MNNKHTPGPWHQLPGNNIVIESQSGNVALCNLARNSDADARLIAAAPELLEALNGLYEDQLDYIRINNLSGAENNHWMKAAKAAIAKAVG